MVWGATPDEAAATTRPTTWCPAPCCSPAPSPCGAPAALTWRWLCQVAVAPYSYDWIDNRGRRSPQTLTPGADQLEVGQTMAIVFRLTSFDDGHHWTAITTPRGRAAVRPGRDDVRRRARRRPTRGSSAGSPSPPRGPLGRVRAHALAWGDLVMMRRQFLNLKALAERDATPLAVASCWRARPSRAAARRSAALRSSTLPESRTAQSAASARR